MRGLVAQQALQSGFCLNIMRYCFSGHESFQCKSLWLKKGFDFLHNGYLFSQSDSVVKLGVGKNMVASIRFWLRAFGLTKNDVPTEFAYYLFDEQNGKDKFAEDIFTLWLLHFLIVYSEVASLYKLLFVDFQKEKKEFTKSDIQAFVRRKCSVPEQKNVYNDNTVKKDIGVLFKQYVSPDDIKTIEDFSSLLIPLNLIVKKNSETFCFCSKSADNIEPELILFALSIIRGEDKTISFDKLQELALMFCISITTLIEIIKTIEQEFASTIVFTDNSGIKNVQFISDIKPLDILNSYYD